MEFILNNVFLLFFIYYIFIDLILIQLRSRVKHCANIQKILFWGGGWLNVKKVLWAPVPTFLRKYYGLRSRPFLCFPIYTRAQLQRRTRFARSAIGGRCCGCAISIMGPGPKFLKKVLWAPVPTFSIYFRLFFKQKHSGNLDFQSVPFTVVFCLPHLKSRSPYPRI
jgi:hypothetical protein